MRCLLTVGLAALLAPAALAQPSPASALNCATPGGDQAAANGHIAWPVGAPIWEFDFYRPANVTAGSGTGVEVRDVFFRGRKVFERASVPIINVEYDAGAGCGCFRDWQSSEAGFAAPVRAGGTSTACYVDATAGAVVTNCTADGAAGPVPDQGSFRGVSVEDYGTELVLTSNMSAGWYRYRMKWHFYTDGRIWPEYSFAAASNACTASARRHHVYWRFDFDLEGTPSNDVVTETSATSITTTFTTEASRTWGTATSGTRWSVVDAATGAGYRIEPSEADLETPVDAFSRLDALVLRYRTGEIDDVGGGCAFNYEPWVNGETVTGNDVVFWYRTGTTRPSGQSRCEIGGPTLRPIGSFATAVDGGPAPVASAIEVQAAVPNPFTPQTSVRFRVAEGQDVRVLLYDALGRQVRTLFEGPLEAGVYETVEVDGAGLPAGTYVVRVEGATAAGSTRIVLSR
jgi:hypothetical protein